jgi:hypothetical protein
MDETIRTAAISPLRQRLIDDMNMRRFSPATQHSYIRDVGRLATFLGHSPDTATADDVRRLRSSLLTVRSRSWTANSCETGERQVLRGINRIVVKYWTVSALRPTRFPYTSTSSILIGTFLTRMPVA